MHNPAYMVANWRAGRGNYESAHGSRDVNIESARTPGLVHRVSSMLYGHGQPLHPTMIPQAK